MDSCLFYCTVILFYCTCAAGLTDRRTDGQRTIAERPRLPLTPRVKRDLHTKPEVTLNQCVKLHVHNAVIVIVN